MGRRARVEGTGIEVFEIIQAYLAADRDRGELGQAFHWPDDAQVDAALAYHRLFPEDVEPFLFQSDEELEALIREHWRRHPRSQPASA